MDRYTCFVISPIGEEDSDVREAANDFLELLVEPAVAGFGFDVIRADRIARPTVITADIVRLVQEAELCIIDLTGSNPNVFYECGRRHESGKPFIQLVRKDRESVLPFDVAGIRTISYDLSSPRSVLDSQRELQDYVAQIAESGFETTTSGESLSSLAAGIERIDRKLTRLTNGLKGSSGRTGQKIGSIEWVLKPPRRAWEDALEAGSMDLAFSALDRIRAAGTYQEYVSAVGIMATLGEQAAFDLFEEEIEKLVEGSVDRTDSDGDDILEETVFALLKTMFENTGRGQEGLEYMTTLFDRIQPKDDISAIAKGGMANRIGMLAWVVRDFETCVKYHKLALDYDPSEVAHWYNLALVYEQLEMADELESTLTQLARMPRLSETHRRILTRNGFPWPGDQSES